MPLYETFLQVQLPQVEAVPIDVGPAYPYPRLQLQGSSSAATEIRALVLENEYLKVAVLPDLGGRIILPFQDALDLHVTPGGKRGVKMTGGVEFSLDGVERLNAMGPVDCRVLDEGDEPSILIGEFASGEGVSWYLRMTLPLDRPTVSIDVKVFNRERLARSGNPGFLVPNGIWVGAEPGMMDGSFRHADRVTMAPRQSDSWKCELVPTELEGSVGWSESALASWDSSLLKVQPLRDMQSHKVVLLVEGKRLETTVDLMRGKVATFDLSGLPTERVAIVGPDGPVFDWTIEPAMSASYEESVKTGNPAGFNRELSKADARGASYVGLALGASRDGEYERALQFLDDSLCVNAEDPLAWWLKATLLRHLGQPNESELLNAHFLAPFEPTLRAESYLAAPSEGHTPSALLESMMGDPDLAIEVAVQLHEAGLMDDLAKWVDECRRHREVPMLRYLLADALMNNSRMRAEAAVHVMAVATAPINPPYPWRRVEKNVLDRLSSAFPDDARLQELAKGLRLPTGANDSPDQSR